MLELETSRMRDFHVLELETSRMRDFHVLELETPLSSWDFAVLEVSICWDPGMTDFSITDENGQKLVWETTSRGFWVDVREHVMWF